MKLYKITLIGGTSVEGTEEDVAKVVQAVQAGAKLVRVRSSLINPSSISSITRSWATTMFELDKDDTELGTVLSKQLK